MIDDGEEGPVVTTMDREKFIEDADRLLTWLALEFAKSEQARSVAELRRRVPYDLRIYLSEVDYPGSTTANDLYGDLQRRRAQERAWLADQLEWELTDPGMVALLNFDYLDYARTRLRELGTTERVQ